MTMIDENWVKSATPGLCDRHFRGGTWVDIIAHIRCIETGEVRKYETQTIFWDEDENYPNTYIWSEGNYSCSCNRYSFFEQATGRKCGDISDHECGDDEYMVNLENPKTGEVYYREF